MATMIRSALLGSVLMFGTAYAARAAEPLQIVLKDQQFTPADLRVPAGERVRIELHNQGSAPAEWESSELKFEKVVVPGGKITVSVGPLKPGTYKYFNEYHPEATGTITAVQGLAEK